MEEILREYTIDLFADEYKLTFKQAEAIMYDLDIEDILRERYSAELKEKEETVERDWDYEEAHWSDGWKDHVSV